MRKIIQNYIFISFGTTIIILLITFHLIRTINILVYDYNNFVAYVNRIFNRTYSEYDIPFFGKDYTEFNFLVDINLVIIIILIVAMLFLKIYWSEREKNRGVM